MVSARLIPLLELDQARHCISAASRAGTMALERDPVLVGDRSEMLLGVSSGLSGSNLATEILSSSQKRPMRMC